MRRIALAILCLALASWPAHAQTKKPPLAVTGNPIEDIKTDIANATTPPAVSASEQKVLAALAKPFQDLASFIGEDADGAIALSRSGSTESVERGSASDCDWPSA